MDPGAHTLAGALLAQSGLKTSSRYAMPTLLIGANLPDVDAAMSLISRDLALHYRRGWTHGILAMAVLPLLLAGAVWLWHRWRGPGDATSPPYLPGVIVALSYLAVLSHPLLDWLNTYGIRLLMPFDGSWFYGDTLFIVDPWFWLLAGAGIVLARPAARLDTAAWGLVALLATLLILSTERAAPADHPRLRRSL